MCFPSVAWKIQLLAPIPPLLPTPMLPFPPACSPSPTLSQVNKIGKINLAATGKDLNEEAQPSDVGIDWFAAVDAEAAAESSSSARLRASEKLRLLLALLNVDDWWVTACLLDSGRGCGIMWVLARRVVAQMATPHLLPCNSFPSRSLPLPVSLTPSFSSHSLTHPPSPPPSRTLHPSIMPHYCPSAHLVLCL